MFYSYLKVGLLICIETSSTDTTEPVQKPEAKTYPAQNQRVDCARRVIVVLHSEYAVMRRRRALYARRPVYAVLTNV